MSVAGSTTRKSPPVARPAPQESSDDENIADVSESRRKDLGSGAEADEDKTLELTIRGPKPDKYHGDRKGLTHWLLQLDVCFFWNPHITGEQGERTVFATGFMRSRALTWMEPHLENYLRK